MDKVNENPLISVIVPIYNAAPYLPRCIDSVLKQTYNNLEVILINDGSTDGSEEICEQYAQRDTRVRVINQANAGVSSARNAGLDAMRGQWVAFLDSDDYIEPQTYEQLLKTAQKNNVMLASCGTVWHSLDGRITERVSADIPDVVTGRQAIDCLFSSKPVHINSLWTKLYCVNLINGNERVRFDTSLHRQEDAIFVLQVFLAIDKIACLPKALYHHCKYNNCATIHDELSEKDLTMLMALNQRVDIVKAKLPGYVRAAKCTHTVKSNNFLSRVLGPCASEKEKRFIPIIRQEAMRYMLNYLFSGSSLKDKFKYLRTLAQSISA